MPFRVVFSSLCGGWDGGTGEVVPLKRLSRDKEAKRVVVRDTKASLAANRNQIVLMPLRLSASL
jgi:hypothetical protein